MSIGKPVGGVARMFRSFSTSGFYRKSKHAFKRMLQATKVGQKMFGGFANFKNWWKRHLMNINVFDTLGYTTIGPIDGHNIKAVEKALEKAKKIDKSVVVHIRTIKGKGYKYAESDTRGVWHGVGKFDPETGAIECKSDTWSWSEIYKECIVKRMRDDKDSITIVPATQLGSALTDVFEEFPERCIDVGIAEEHAVTMAGGLAISGKHPIISIYSTFLQRAYDEVSHDIARIGLNATILVDRAGLVGNDGGTHQGLYDESFLMSIPNTVVAMASNSAQANALMEETKKPHGVFCIRYPRSYATLTKKVENIPFGTWKKELSGKGTALVSVGPETEVVKQLIQDKGLEVTLFNAIYQKPMDESCIKELLDYDKVVIYDAYATETGFANTLCARLMELGYKGKVVVKTVPTDFVRHASIIQQEAKFGLLPEDIVKLL